MSARGDDRPTRVGARHALALATCLVVGVAGAGPTGTAWAVGLKTTHTPSPSVEPAPSAAASPVVSVVSDDAPDTRTTDAPRPTIRDLAYATVSPAQVLDLWLPPDATGPTPLVLLVHGGGFRRGDKANEAGLVPPLLDAGYAVASMGYRLSDEARFPAAVQDVKAAVRFLRANAATYGLDPARFAAWGRSAGGYLVAMLGATGDQSSPFDDPALGHPAVSSGVLAVIDVSGPSDMTRMDAQLAADLPPTCAGHTTVHDSPDSTESRFLGVALRDAGALAAVADPATWLATARRLPAFVLVTGDADCRVPMAQSLLLHGAIGAAGGSSRLLVVAGVGHNDPRVIDAVMSVALRTLAKVFDAPLPVASGAPDGPR